MTRTLSLALSLGVAAIIGLQFSPGLPAYAHSWSSEEPVTVPGRYAGGDLREGAMVSVNWGLPHGTGHRAPRVGQVAGLSESYEYRVLATSRTSTMEREMNEAADDGYRFQGVMGGETAFGGAEVVSVMMKGAGTTGRFAYRLLATNQTSTMQQEMRAAGDEGFDYRGQTVFDTLFGGEEVVVILERDNDLPDAKYDYLLLATSQTSTLQAELSDAGERGFQLVGLSVGETTFGGDEVVAITRRVVAP